MSAIAAGTMVHGHQLAEIIGEGAMGAVYRALRVADGQLVALKVMHAEAAANATLRQRFFREARTAMAVAHPNIVRIYDVFEHETLPVLSMEYLSGQALDQVLVRVGRLSLAALAPLMVRVTSAVGTAHAYGVVHRDLKPANIFLIAAPYGTDVKVLDFGIAKLTATEGNTAETVSLTRTGAVLGTPFYMSPEQAMGEKTIDQRSDVWSLGIVLYQCLSGILPTEGSTFAEIFRHVLITPMAPIRQLVPDLPPDVAALIDRMLSRKAADRPWDLREVHTVLERYTQPASG